MIGNEKSIGQETTYTDAGAKSVMRNTFVTIIDGKRMRVKVAEKTLDIFWGIVTGIVCITAVTLIPYAVVYFFGG